MGAPGPHDFAVRVCAARLSAHPRPPHSAPRVMTIAIRPSCRRGMGGGNHHFRKNERGYFLREDLERTIGLRRRMKFDLWRTRFRSGNQECENRRKATTGNRVARRAFALHVAGTRSRMSEAICGRTLSSTPIFYIECYEVFRLGYSWAGTADDHLSY